MCGPQLGHKTTDTFVETQLFKAPYDSFQPRFDLDSGSMTTEIS